MGSLQRVRIHSYYSSACPHFFPLRTPSTKILLAPRLNLWWSHVTTHQTPYIDLEEKLVDG